MVLSESHANVAAFRLVQRDSDVSHIMFSTQAIPLILNYVYENDIKLPIEISESIELKVPNPVEPALESPIT